MNNIKKLFVPYQEALDMKLLGFDEYTLPYWNIDPQFKNPLFNIGKPFKHEWVLPSPTYSQCFSWFREKYNIHSWIDSKRSDNLGDIRYFRFMPTFNLSNKINLETLGYYETFEKAELECLKQLIKYVGNENT